MSKTTVAASLASRLRDIRFEQLDTVTLRSAKARLLDALGIMISGLKTPTFGVVKRYLGALERIGSAQASRPGGIEDIFPARTVRLDAESYGFITGASAFIENYGDTSLYSVTHPNTVIIPAALVAARARPITGSDLLAAIVGGYQVMEFLGRTLNNGLPRMGHQVRGFRPTATCGPAGAVAVLAKLCATEEADVAQSFGVACNLAAGLRRTDAGETTHMRIHSGEAVRNGVEALSLVQAGLRIDAAFIEGPGGFFDAMRGGSLDQSASVYLYEPAHWAINDVAIKIHATPHTLAPGLDCLIEAARNHPGLHREIRSVQIFMPEAHAQISLGAAQVDPAELSAASALDHYPFCAAIALVTGDVVFPHVPATFLGQANTLRLTKLIQVLVGERETKLFEEIPGSWPVRVQIKTSKEEFRLEAMTPFGAVLDDLVQSAVERKFKLNTESELDLANQRDLVELVDHIEDSDDVYRDLLEALGVIDSLAVQP